MNILILSPDSPVNSMGGLGVHLKNLLHNIDNTYYNVTALCLGLKSSQIIEGGKRVYNIYSNIKSEDNDSYLNTFIVQTAYVSIANSLIIEGKINKPDIIHIMDWSTAIAGIQLAKQFNSKIVFAVHLSIINYINKPTILQEISYRTATDVEFNTCKFADKILQVSDYYSNLFPFKIFQNKTEVVYNGVNIQEFKTNRKYKLPGKNKIKILYIGRFAEMKNVQTLLQVIPNFNNIDWLFAGGLQGSSPELLNQIKYLSQTKDNVFYLGYVDKTDKIDLMSSVDLIIMPSKHEPFGLVALEALSAGQNGKTILMSSFVDGMGEFLTKDSAINCGTTVESITNSINYFLSLSKKEKKKLRENGVKLANKYSWQECARNIQNVWESLK